MPRFKDQPYAIKFCVALKKTGAETVAMQREAYDDSTMSNNMVYRWHKRGRESREDAKDEDCSGRPSTSHSDQNVKKVRDMLNSNRRLSVRMLKDECNIPKSTVHRIVIEDLGMRKICAKMVTKLLSFLALFALSQGVATLPQLPYNPDLAPLDLFLFPRIMKELKGHHFGTSEAVKEATTRYLKEVLVDAFQGAFSDWKKRWRRYSDAGGSYFEEF